MDGTTSYHLNRGVVGSGSVSGSVAQTPPTPPGFRSITKPKVEDQSPNFPHGNAMGVASSGMSLEDYGKKKIWWPGKYWLDGASVSLVLSPVFPTTPGSMVLKRGKGRPRGTGRKQRLASHGEWMNSSAGSAFTTHVLHIGVGEDIATKILAFAQLRPRALCILSANGAVSAVQLCQPGGGRVTYEGRFEILCLSGSYLLAERGGPRNRTGGLSITVRTQDGRIIGGAIGGKLIAASAVQAVVFSFIYRRSKSKDKTKDGPKGGVGVHTGENLFAPPSEATSQNVTPNSATSVWPPNSQPDQRNPNTEIDLMHG